MSRKKKIIECDGKVESPKFQPTSLEAIWGNDGTSLYGTLDEKVYAASLDEMNRADLEAHARQIGVILREDSDRIKENLINEFRHHILAYQKPAATFKPQANPTNAVKQILAEGR